MTDYSKYSKSDLTTYTNTQIINLMNAAKADGRHAVARWMGGLITDQTTVSLYPDAVAVINGAPMSTILPAY